jgi:hypothetical protein
MGFLKTALAGSKSYLFLCLFIFQRGAFLETIENQRDDFETLFPGVSKKFGQMVYISGLRGSSASPYILL